MRSYLTLAMLLYGQVLWSCLTTCGTTIESATSDELTTVQSSSTNSTETPTTLDVLPLTASSELFGNSTRHLPTESQDLTEEPTFSPTNDDSLDSSKTTSTSVPELIENTSHLFESTDEITSGPLDNSSVTLPELNITNDMSVSSTTEPRDCPGINQTRSSCVNASEPNEDFTSMPNTLSTNTSSLSDNWSSIILGGFYLVTSCLVVISNITVMYVIAKTRDLHQTTLWVIAHMAFWDFFQGFSYLIFVIPSAFLNRFVYHKSLISATACLFSFLSGITVFNTATVVVDRFICLKFPLIYRKSSGGKFFPIVACCVFVLAVVRMALISFPDSDFYYNDTFAMCLSDYNTIQGAVGSIGFIGIAFGIIVVCSFIIVCMIYRRQRPGEGQRSGDSSSAAVIRLSMMITISASIFCLSYLPFSIAVIWNLVFGRDAVPGAYLKFVAVAVLSNSIWNVVIYSANYTPFRQALMQTFCKSYLIRKKREREHTKRITRLNVHVVDSFSSIANQP